MMTEDSLLCRTPPGVRELKRQTSDDASRQSRRTPPGVRELKLWLFTSASIIKSRTPPGVRELKLTRVKLTYQAGESHPSRGA